MAWTWRYESADGRPVTVGTQTVSDGFPSQGDAESWLGESWRELLDSGVEQVSLLDDGREVYGPMGLRAQG